MTREADEDYCTPGAHKTIVATRDGSPTLYGAECSCGWESEYLSTDPECAETDGVNHEREAT